MQVFPGRRIGPYEIVASIGAGGMGEVWRARDPRIGRDVAIKFIPESFHSPDRLHRFEQEARAAGSINHPNLVTVYDLGTESSTPYVVMELLDGETLRDKLGDRLPLRKAVEYAVQIANGLAAAHEHGVVHRDLKPENIIVTSDGRVKIIDFGLAKLSSRPDGGASNVITQQRDTAPGTVLGTAGYMSPEQVRGQQIDHRSDIFSLGSILYEMFSGRRAFEGDSTVEAMSSILKDDPPDLVSADGHVPPILDAIVRHCLEKSANERFQSARDLGFALQRISSVSGSSPAITGRSARWPWLIPAVALAAAAIAFGVSRQRGQIAAPVASASASAPRRFTLLTNQPGMETYPSLAPDGKTFVYVSDAAGNEDIYLQRVDGRNAINLTKSSAADDTQPAFSPDGSQIAFRSSREGGGIFLMGATGESVRRLTDFGYNPTWSPDGSEIAVGTALLQLAPYGRPSRSTLSIVNIRTGARRDIAGDIVGDDAAQPSWSPHGDRIAYWGVVAQGGQRDIFTIKPHAPNPLQTITRVTSDPPIDWNPVWSADGKYLYFGSDRDGTMNVWRIPMNEREGTTLGPAETVSLPTRFAAHLTFARNGPAVAYAGVDVSDTVWRLPFDPVSLRVVGQPTPVVGGAMLFLRSGDVSPDGQWVALSNSGGQEDLFIARTDGTDLRQLTNDIERDRGPSWSPDGKALYFYSQRGERYETWTIHADGSGLRQISKTNGPSVWFPKLMPDGRSFYAFNDRGTVFLPIEADGTVRGYEALPRGPNGTPLAQPFLSPDGERFIGASSSSLEAESMLWTYSLKTKAYTSLGVQGSTPVWLPDSQRVVFRKKGRLAVVDTRTREVRILPVTQRYFTVSIAPDGRAIYAIERKSESDVWLMK